MEKRKIIPPLRFPEYNGEWQCKQLGKVTEINPSNRLLPEKFIYIDLECVENGELLNENIVLKLGAPSRAQRVLIKGDILFQMVRPYQMNNFYFDRIGDYVASTGYAQIRTKESALFIYQYLHFQKFVHKVIEKCTGTGYPSINSTDLSNIVISLPSIPEQQKIASFLTAIENRLQLLKKKKSLLEHYKKGVIQKIFSKELQFKNDDGTDFPKWEKKKLGKLATRISDGLHSTPNYCEDGDYYFINGNNLINGKVVIADGTKRVNKEEYLKHKRELSDATILLSINGTIGSLALYNNEQIILGKSACYINISNEVNKLFIFYCLQTSIISDFFISELTGTTIKNLSLTTIKNCEISIPIIAEQQKISAFLSSIDNKIYLTNTQLEKTELLKKGLLQKMFI